MAPKRTSPKFSGLLAEPISMPSSGGLLGHLDEEERRSHAFGQQFDKLFLLLDHYGIDRKNKNCWIILSLCLGEEYVPGMRVESSPRSRPGRKRTWKAGMGFDLLRDVEAVRKEKKLQIGDAIDHLRKSDPKWARFTPQNLITRRREAYRTSIANRRKIAELLDQPPMLSLAKLGEAYRAGQSQRTSQMGGLYGIAALAAAPAGTKTDEN
jgi:hypothetical protein